MYVQLHIYCSAIFAVDGFCLGFSLRFNLGGSFGGLLQSFLKASKSAYTANGAAILFLKFLNFTNLFFLSGNTVLCISTFLNYNKCKFNFS